VEGPTPAGFNLSLILRKLLGAGTPREWNDRGRMLILLLLGLFTRQRNHDQLCRGDSQIQSGSNRSTFNHDAIKEMRGNASYTTDC